MTVKGSADRLPACPDEVERRLADWPITCSTAAWRGRGCSMMMTVTHTQRWHAHRHSAGTEPVYQGRFKSFPIQSNEHVLTVLRYVEGNALRAGLVAQAEDWRWGSLWRWVNRVRAAGGASDLPALGEWPMDRPRRWRRLVNEALPDAPLDAVRHSVRRGSPFGGETWVDRTARRLGLESSLRAIGRPR